MARKIGGVFAAAARFQNQSMGRNNAAIYEHIKTGAHQGGSGGGPITGEDFSQADALYIANDLVTIADQPVLMR